MTGVISTQQLTPAAKRATYIFALVFNVSTCLKIYTFQIHVLEWKTFPVPPRIVHKSLNSHHDPTNRGFSPKLAKPQLRAHNIEFFQCEFTKLSSTFPSHSLESLHKFDGLHDQTARVQYRKVDTPDSSLDLLWLMFISLSTTKQTTNTTQS